MNKLNAFASGISLLFFAQAGLACDYPERPGVPNGSTATKEEMIAGQKAFNQYIDDLEAYQSCIVEEDKDARAAMDEELTPEAELQREELLTKKYNAAHDEMLKAAAEFNAELKEYQAEDQ